MLIWLGSKVDAPDMLLTLCHMQGAAQQQHTAPRAAWAAPALRAQGIDEHHQLIFILHQGLRRCSGMPWSKQGLNLWLTIVSPPTCELNEHAIHCIRPGQSGVLC
jgi:hypothetical protein